MSVIKQQVPRILIEFQRELQEHPKLIQQIQLSAKSFEEGLAMACTYVGVVVDGLYDLEPMLDMLIRKLQECRNIKVVDQLPDAKGLVQDAPKVQEGEELTTGGIIVPKILH